MKNDDKAKTDVDWPPIRLLSIFSWSIAIYFFVSIVLNNKDNLFPSLKPSSELNFFLFFFFLFLPFIKKIKIANIFEIERELKNTKKDLLDYKIQTQNMFTALSSTITSVVTQNHNVTINIPNIRDLKEESKKVNDVVKSNSKDEWSTYKDVILKELLSDDDDYNWALARMRIRIEGLLKEVISKYPEEPHFSERRTISAQALFEIFIKKNEEYRSLKQAFRYTISVCNAAIHAQPVSEGQAEEALEIGSKILSILNQELQNLTHLDNTN